MALAHILKFFVSYGFILHILAGSSCFWRTDSGQELDWIEERRGRLYGYEFKWSEKKSAKAPKEWLDTYTNAEYKIIHQGNYLDFVL